MNTTNLFGGIIFGGIGFAAFIYGKKQASAKPMILGITLMAYPYFIRNTMAMYAVGILLTVALFIFRD